MSRPWVIVSPGFHRRGGMEKANHAVAAFLAERGTEVHLVGHSIDGDLAAHPNVVPHPVPRPVASFLLAEGMLSRRGRAVSAEVRHRAPGATILVNGGNCDVNDVNWVHFVHHAWSPTDRGAPLWFRAKNRLLAARARRDETAIVTRARLVISNSRLTTGHLVDLLGVDPDRVRTVYLGAESSWGPPSAEERARARQWLNLPADRPTVCFVGALGYDARKGFDTLLEAWGRLRNDSGWDGALIAAGGGRGLDAWRKRVDAAGLAGSVTLLGFTDRVCDLLAASDLLVSPVRYEAYGLNVQEAICRGLPAIVSRSAGIAERYGPGLQPLVLEDPEDATELARRIRDWRADPGAWHARVATLSAELRAYDWEDMARELVSAVEEGAASRA